MSDLSGLSVLSEYVRSQALRITGLERHAGASLLF
jgi:hypothetical protein